MSSPDNPPSNQSTFGPQQFANASWPAEPSQQQIMPSQQYSGAPASNPYEMGYPNPQNGQYMGQQQYGASSLATPPTDQQIQAQVAGQMAPAVVNRYPTPDLGYPSISSQQSQSFTPQPPQPLQTAIPRQDTPSTQSAPSIVNRPSNQSVSSLVSPPASDSPVSASSTNESTANVPSKVAAPSTENTQTSTAFPAPSQTSQDVYHAITKAYDYTESYHFLMKFLPTRCDSPILTAEACFLT